MRPGAVFSMDPEDSKTGPDLEPDTIARALGAGAFGGEPESSAAIFVGLLADDDDGAFVRVYQDYELQTYVRVPRESIRHRERTRNTAGLEVSIVLVDSRAQVEIRESSSEEFQADVLAKALQASEAGVSPESSEMKAAWTPTPGITVRVCIPASMKACPTRTCTSRHSLLCSIACTDHPVCPNPWTTNWFCQVK